MTVNQKELAQCLGISARRIRQLQEEGLFKSNQEQRGYSLEKCVREYIDYKVTAETGRRTSISKEAVQAEHEEVKKQISLLKLRKLRRELHAAADVEFYLTDMLTRFKNRLLSLAPKMALEVSGESDVNEIIESIKQNLLNALEELTEYSPDEIDRSAGPGAESEGDDDEEEDDEVEEDE